MNTKSAACSLIVITTAAFSISAIISQQRLPMAVSIGLGVIWLVMELRGVNTLSSALFLGFLSLAIWGSLNGSPILVSLLGLSTNLAAWDLSRLQTRLADHAEGSAVALLERKHLRKLAVTLCLGFLIAVLPLIIHISISFAMFSLILLIAIGALRRSILYLRS